ncbi:hypothetical protein B0H11DRAFT_2351324 [Mycena galericulata]|nr:hypothetical protein B0H11DRAFT_2351324 [Mycena galericulata]
MQQLYDFHRTCGRAAQALAEEYFEPGPVDVTIARDLYAYLLLNSDTNDEFIWWVKGQDGFHSVECGPRSVATTSPSLRIVLPAQWFRNHIKALGSKLCSVPTLSTVDTEVCAIAAAERDLINGCHTCMDSADNDLANFRAQLGPLIEESNNTLAEQL